MLDLHVIRTLEDAGRPFQLHYQGGALNALIGHARRVSPWWREWLAPPPGVPGVPLKEMRLLEREDFRAAVEAGGPLPLPHSHGAVRENASSGSSGVPVKFFVSELAGRIVDACFFDDHRRHGRDLRQKAAALLTRFAPHPGVPHRLLPADPLQGIGPIATRRSQDRPVREHAAWLRAVDPVYLNTSPTVLAGMLDAYEAGETRPSNLRQVLSIGETVTPSLRRRTRELLGASIRDRYSCEEIGPIALQCPHDTSDEPPLHTCIASVIVEVVDEAGQACAPGVPGRVLVTALHHWASPAIRYDIGDVAALAPQCTCGAQVPTLTRLLGRKRFLIRLPSGERKLLKLDARQWLSVAPVREYRVTQHAMQSVRAELVMDRELTQQEHEAALKLLREEVHPEFQFEVVRVKKIDWQTGAKRQDVVSLV
ncbi:MAG: AMP-binding protein [Burkholderiaceae bacterium]